MVNSGFILARNDAHGLAVLRAWWAQDHGQNEHQLPPPSPAPPQQIYKYTMHLLKQINLKGK